MRRISRRTVRRDAGGIGAGGAFGWLLVIWLLLVLSSFLGRYGWPFELLANLRLQLAAGSLLLLLAALLLRRWWGALALALALALSLLPPWLYLSRQAPGSGAPPLLRIVTLDLGGHAPAAPALSSFLAAAQADLVVLSGLDGTAGLSLPPLDALPHRQASGGETRGEILLLARGPIENLRVVRHGAKGQPYLAFEFCPAAASCLRVVALSAPSPWRGPKAKRQRDIMLKEAAITLGPAPHGILLGNFNLTTWSPVFARTLGRAGLRDSAIGLDGTWPVRNPLLGLRLQHLLIGGKLQTTGWRVGPDLDGRHLPLIVDLALR